MQSTTFPVWYLTVPPASIVLAALGLLAAFALAAIEADSMAKALQDPCAVWDEEAMPDCNAHSFPGSTRSTFAISKVATILILLVAPCVAAWALIRDRPNVSLGAMIALLPVAVGGVIPWFFGDHDVRIQNPSRYWTLISIVFFLLARSVAGRLSKAEDGLFLTLCGVGGLGILVVCAWAIFLCDDLASGDRVNDCAPVVLVTIAVASLLVLSRILVGRYNPRLKDIE